MKKNKMRSVRVQGRSSGVRCPQLRGAFMAVQRAPRAWRFLAVFLLVAVGVGVVAFFVRLVWMTESVRAPEQQIESTQVTFRHPYTGVLRDTELAPTRVAGVMVENSADAWPLSGIEDAFLVIEAPAEADIPRFLAFYSEDQDPVAKIGPVRSARPYYIDWASDYGALYAHVGGSPEALQKIRDLGTVVDFDQFFESEYFWRSTDRYAPHNVYTSTDLLWSGADELELMAPLNFESSNFLDQEYSQQNSTQEVVVDWASGSTYDFSWRMTDAGQYVRYRGEQPVLSADGDRYVVENVIAIQTDIEVIDEMARKALRTLGEGRAWVFVAGREIEALWQKKTAADRLRFYEVESGVEVAPVPGRTWIGVIPIGGSVQVQ